MEANWSPTDGDRRSQSPANEEGEGEGEGEEEEEGDQEEYNLRKRVQKVISDMEHRDNLYLIKKLHQRWMASPPLWTSGVPTADLNDAARSLYRSLAQINHEKESLLQMCDMIAAKISIKRGILQMLQASELGQIKKNIRKR